MGIPPRESDPCDFLESLPYALGFVPTESIVVAPLAGSGGALPCARIDIPTTATDRIDAADILVEAYQRARGERSVEVALVAFTERQSTAMLAMDAISAMFEQAQMVVDVRLAVDDTHWVDIDRGMMGHRDPQAAARIAAEAAFAGIAAPLPSRDTLVEQLQGHDSEVRELLETGPVEASASAADAIDWARDVVARFHTDQVSLDGESAARLITSISDARVFEAVWSDLDRSTATLDMSLWADVTQRAPQGRQSDAALMLAYASWIGGKGAHGLVALDAIDPGRHMETKTALLSVILTAGIAPSRWDEFKADPGSVEAVVSTGEIDAVERDRSRTLQNRDRRPPGI